MIYISSQQLQELHRHGEMAYPRECCGLLLGTCEGEQARVTEVWPAENAWDEESAVQFEDVEDSTTSERRYTIAPELMLAAQKTARDRRWQILGIYHSHPNHEAIPSECDRQWAWPEYYYLIMAVRDGQAGDSRCWRLDERRQFQEVLIDRSIDGSIDGSIARA
ncbi:MAG: M67 family peptidase [Phormidium sp. SL48-SHIP]|nr:MAG: M67 family peptidase [Phormidium sp. SL48-SHIP]